MNYPVPLLLMIGPLAAAFVTQMLGSRPRIAALVGAVLAWWLAWWITAVPLPTENSTALFVSKPLNIAQQQLVLTPAGQSLIPFLLIVLGGLFLLTLLLPQPTSFVPGGLLLIVPVGLVLMLQNSLLQPPLVLFALGLLAVITQSKKPTAQTAMPLLGVAVLGTVGLLLVGGQTAVYANSNWVLLAVIMLLLGGFPLHFWMLPVAEKLSGPGLLLVFAWMPLVLMALLRNHMLVSAIWQDSQFIALLQWSGAAAALIAALVIVFAHTFSRLVAGLVSLDIGITLLALSIPGGMGEQTAVSLHLNRIFSLLIMSVAWYWLKANGFTTIMSSSQGLGRQAQFSTFLFIFGGFSLIGLPLTPGFSGRWALMASLSQIGQAPTWLLILLLLSMVGAALGILRLLAILVKQLPQTHHTNAEPRWIRGAVALLLGISIVFAAFPQLITTVATRIVGLS